MRIGVLTGGGGCPGLNAVMRAVVKSAINDYGILAIGFRDSAFAPGEYGLIARHLSRRK